MIPDRELLNILKRLEVELHQSELWRDPDRLEALLHEDFEEVGQSGQRFSRSQVIAALADRSAHRPPIESGQFELRSIDERAALLLYISASRDPSGEHQNAAWRSSLWIHTAEGWKLRFHQGTPTTERLRT